MNSFHVHVILLSFMFPELPLSDWVVSDRLWAHLWNLGGFLGRIYEVKKKWSITKDWPVSRVVHNMEDGGYMQRWKGWVMRWTWAVAWYVRNLHCWCATWLQQGTAAAQTVVHISLIWGLLKWTCLRNARIQSWSDSSECLLILSLPFRTPRHAWLCCEKCNIWAK